MSQRTRLSTWLDFGLLSTLLLCLFALWPLLAQPGLPNGTDVLYHAYRVGEMDRAWTHGVFLPRWAEGLYYGYGSPLFHYYAGSTYYLTSILMRVFQLDALNSLRAVIVIAVLGSGAGMYLLLRERVSKLAGVIAALVYVYSPYLVYTEPYARGDYPELLALALFPWVAWRFTCLLDYRRARDALFSALLVALLIITHNLMALVLFGLLTIWLLWQFLFAVVLSDKANRPYKYYGSIFLVAGLGVGLTAYFWLPVLIEHDAVHLENLTAVALLDYRNFFVPFGHLLAHSFLVDAGAMNGLLHRLNLGVAQWVLALTGLIGLLIVEGLLTRSLRDLLKHKTVQQALFFAVMGLLLIFLIVPASAGIWGAINALSMLQFPWRFLGPVIFCLAMLAGLNAVWIERLPKRIGQVMVAGVVVLPVALALPTLYVPEWVHETLDTSITAYHESEVSGLQSGTTFTDEYLPKDVYVLADDTSWLLEDYAESYSPGGDGQVDKAHRAFLPDGVTIELVEHHPQADVWQVEAAEPFTMEVLTHYFVGWTAEVDGQAVAITPSDPHGFINFPVSAGTHTINLYLGSTLDRSISVLLTALSGLGLLVMVRQLQIRRTGQKLPAFNHLKSGWRVALGIGLGLNLLLVVIFMREGVAWVNSPAGEALPVTHPVTYDLQGVDNDVVIQFLGYDLPTETYSPGDRVELVVYWYAPEAVPYHYQSFVHISQGGPPVAQADLQNPAGRPTTEWTPDGYAYDEYLIFLPETLAPGEYNLLVGLYTCETLPAGECGNGDRLQVVDDADEVIGDAVLLTTLTVQ